MSSSQGLVQDYLGVPLESVGDGTWLLDGQSFRGISGRVLLIGAQGQLGRSFALLFEKLGVSAILWTRRECDLSASNALENLPADVAIIINCSAYTAVDLAETERELCEKLNAEVPERLALLCCQRRIPFLHFSTDYVFSGDAPAPNRLNDECQPINHYGASKRRGEVAVLAAYPDALIIRTSWVFSPFGKNFVRTISERLRKGQACSVVDDQRGQATYAPDLALASLLLQERGARGLAHFSNAGELSWYEFAKAIADYLDCKNLIRACSSEEFKTVAKRPHSSVLDLAELQNFGIVPRFWEKALGDCLKHQSW